LPSTHIINIDKEHFVEEVKALIKAFDNNLWIMKPPDLNRGQGIRLLDSLDFVFRTLASFSSLPTNDPQKNKVKARTAVVKYEGG
jgi:Tubulin-tyrosine ligase family